MLYSRPFLVVDRKPATLRRLLEKHDGWRQTGPNGFHHHWHSPQVAFHFWPSTGRLVFQGDPATVQAIEAYVERTCAPWIVAIKKPRRDGQPRPKKPSESKFGMRKC